MLLWIAQNNKGLCLIFLFFSFLTRLISPTFLPNYDEWYYLASWNSLKNDGILYKTILDNKPPLAYFLYVIPDVLSLYITLSVLSAVIAYFTYRISDNLYAGYVFLLITGAIPSYLELNLEYWVLACIVPAYYYLLKKENIVWYRWAYFLCGASLMIKQHSLLLIIPIIIYGIANNQKLFLKSIYYIAIAPAACFCYILYNNTLYDFYQWTIKYNFWYRKLSETGRYIWKRFLYGQLFAMPLYLGIMISMRNMQKKLLHFILILAFFLSVISAWIGRELYLHYQILIFPFLILLFCEISFQKYKIYVYIGILCIFIFGQGNYIYTYLYSQKTWLTRLEGVISREDKNKIIPIKSDKAIIFSADRCIGLDYRKVKYIASWDCLEYLKQMNNSKNQLLTCNLYVKDAIYIVPRFCLERYVGNLRYKIVYIYEDNIGIEIEECK